MGSIGKFYIGFALRISHVQTTEKRESPEVENHWCSVICHWFCWTFAKKTRNVIVLTRFGQKSGQVLKTKFNVKICTYYLFADGKEQELRLSCYPISWMNGQNSRVVVHHFNLGYMIFILRPGLELTEVVHWWLAIFLITLAVLE